MLTISGHSAQNRVGPFLEVASLILLLHQEMQQFLPVEEFGVLEVVEVEIGPLVDLLHCLLSFESLGQLGLKQGNLL